MARWNWNRQLWIAILLVAELCLGLFGSLTGNLPTAAAAKGQEVLIAKYHNGDYGIWITLANVTDHDIDLTNWYMNDYKSPIKMNPKWKFPDHTTIKAKSLLIVEQVGGSGSIGASEHGIPVVASPDIAAFTLSPGGEYLQLWKGESLQDELAFRFAYPDAPFFIADSLENSYSSFERKSTVDTDTEEDWQRIDNAERPDLAWEWGPLTGSPVSTTTPLADKITFATPQSTPAQLRGQDGAVEVNAEVKVYTDSSKEVWLATATATKEGSFQTSFNNESLLQEVYITAKAPGKTESTATAVKAAAPETDKVLIAKYHVGHYGSWITLANVTNHDIDLTNWQMNDYKTPETANPKWSFPAHTIIKAKSLLVVAETNGSGTSGTADSGIPLVEVPSGSTFGLLAGAEKLVLWQADGQQADELIFKLAYPDSPFIIEDDLNDGDSAFERSTILDRNKAEDWKKVTQVTPIAAWVWSPLTGNTNTEQTAAPGASLIRFHHTNPSSAQVTGQDGAVEPSSTVVLYDRALGKVLGRTKATAQGAFDLTFNDETMNKTVVLTARAPRKTESVDVVLTESFDETTKAPIADRVIYNDTFPESALITGQAGAVEANAIVTFYDNAAKEHELGRIDAGPDGAFQASITRELSLKTIYVTAIVPGKNESVAVALPAVVFPPTTDPVAEKMTFENTKPSAGVIGQDGAVEPSADIQFYNSANKGEFLGGVSATATGSFQFFFNNVNQLKTVYVVAWAPNKPASKVIAVPLVGEALPPTEVSHTPASGAADVVGNAPVEVVFNMPITAGLEIQNVSIKDQNNKLVEGVQASVSGSKLLISHAPFANTTSYRVNVPAQSVQDVAGNVNVSELTWSFTTSTVNVAAAEVSINLPDGNKVKQGQVFDVDVLVNKFTSVYGAQFQLKYDPQKLKVVRSVEPQLLPGELWNDHADVTYIQKDQPDIGIATFAGALVGESAGMNGTEPISIAKVKFEAISESGMTTLDLPTDSVKLAAYPGGAGSMSIPVQLAGPVQINLQSGTPTSKATVSLATVQTEVQAGKPFTVQVNVYEYTDVHGAQVQLTYDPARLQLQDNNSSEAGVQVKAGTLFAEQDAIELYNQADIKAGKVNFASMLRGATEGVSGKKAATIAELTFIPTGNFVGPTSLILEAGQVKLAGNPSSHTGDWKLPFDVKGTPLVVHVNEGGPDQVAPTWPINSKLEAEQVTNQSVTLKWTPASDQVGVTQYKIFKEDLRLASDSVLNSVYSTVTHAVYRQEVVTTHESSYTVNDLLPNASYRFSVEAGDAANNWSVNGPRVTVTTLTYGDQQPPTWPANSKLVLSDIGYTTASLKWPQALDNMKVTAYRIYQDGKFLTTVTGDVYGYTVTGLYSNTAYTFEVQAGDASGNWSSKLTLAVTTNRYSSGGGGTSGGSPSPTPKPTEAQTLSPNGITLPKEAMKITRKETTAFVTFDDKMLADAFRQLKGASAGAQRITIPLDVTESTVQLQFNAQVLASGAADAPNVNLVVQSGSVGYELPIHLLSLVEKAKELGVELKDLKLIIKLTAITGSKLDQLQASRQGMTLLSAAEFTISVEGGGQTRIIDNFNGTLVKRTFALPSGLDHKQLTGVRFENNQPVYVPTLFQTIDGVLTGVILSSMNSTYAIIQHKKTFSDLAGHWSKPDVELLASKLVVEGTTDSSFSPDTAITRAEFAAILIRALGLPTNVKGAAFKDVSSSDWFYGAVSSAVKASLIEGIEEGYFKPQDRITREQMAIMMARALKVSGKSKAGSTMILDKLSDKNKVSVWAIDALGQVLDAGIMQGMTDQTFEPGQPATRAQAAVMLKRLLQYVGYMNN
ncbi:hypothetical protein GK047_02380 [Paenibacillus sp. SYP-B3998]|uniref:S-layer homology domain-containing protein n=1 Tax=Paenibacillus sp. SYP-B3998 TaxID=2678564 RepID=A0A6G3ZRM8_9BACL|nr:S-layer homology domain-containing protein [Paenibacillus sp. SYP-B3998]NEW04866.1 hypothetical protein [Paenibacillus sp. SYP-B3998]